MPQFESPFEQNLFQQRLEKLQQIREVVLRLEPGLTPAEALYPNRFPAADEPVHLSNIPHLLARYDTPSAPVSAEELEAERPQVAVAGRLMSHRLQGKAGFAHLQQGGKRLQIYLRRDDVGDDAFALYKLLDLGDHLGVRGVLMRTRTGELTLKALPLHGKPALSFLAKAMLALPDKYHGLEDVELRYRQRYVDLIMNSGTLAKADPVTAADNATPSPPSPTPPSPTPPSRIPPSSIPPASNAVILSAAPELVEGAQSKDPHNAGAATSPSALSTSAALPPGVSAVTDTALPNEEHNDAPRNVREVFVKRAQILRALRRFFDERGFLEVETPMMHPVAGGAAARPFKTHHNALDLDLSLRIAPELYLKRLVVGGMDRVYEINRNFRNEGISTQHNPEFTMLEFYQAYSNYHDLMDLTQELIQYVAIEVNGTTKTHFNGTEIDLSKWQKLSMREAIVKFWNHQQDQLGDAPTMSDFSDFGRFAKFLRQGEEEFFDIAQTIERMTLGMHPRDALTVQQNYHASLTTAQRFSYERYRELRDIIDNLDMFESLGNTIAFLFERLAEPHLIQPTIIYDFPLAVSPLSKIKPDEPDWVERFEFYIGGFEVGNAFSELNDPVDQRQRFEAQLREREKGDEEAMAAMDEDYVRALGYGLPPTAGEGIGIDRLTMLLTGSRSIRDVILFPLMRPRAEPTSPNALPAPLA